MLYDVFVLVVVSIELNKPLANLKTIFENQLKAFARKLATFGDCCQRKQKQTNEKRERQEGTRTPEMHSLMKERIIYCHIAW